MKKIQDARKRGLAPRSLVADEGRRSALESLDRPFSSPAAAFVRAALDEGLQVSAGPSQATAVLPSPAASAPVSPAARPPTASSPAPAPTQDVPTSTATSGIRPSGDRLLLRVPLEAIDLTRRRFQYRVSRNLARLQESVLLQGQQVPVILRGAAPPYEIVSGFGRCEAIALGHAQGKIPDPMVWADVRADLSDREAHEISVLENEDREGISELDRVSKARKLKDEGYSIAEIAFILKKGERMVQYYLSLSEAPARIGEALAQGRLRPTHALVLTKFAREALGELDPHEVEAKLEGLIDRCSRGASVTELRAETRPASASPAPESEPKLIVRRGDGFDLRVHYSIALSEEKRKAILEMLDEARKVVADDLESDFDV